MRSRAVATAAVLAAAVAPAAHAAAPWSAPQTLSATHQFVEPIDLAFARDGSGLAFWTYQDGVNARAATGAGGATSGSRATAFGPPHALVTPHRTDRGATLVGVVGRRLRITLVSRHVDPRRPDAFRLRANGRRIASGPQMLRVTLASNARGDAAIAWWERARRSQLFVAVRRAGHRFGPARRIATRGFGDVAPAVGPRAQMLVAWESGGVIRARSRTPHGAAFGPAMRVASRDADGADVAAGLSRYGRAVVAWGSQLRTSGGDTGPIAYAAAIRRPGGSQFGTTVLERQPATRIAQPVGLTVDPSGRATFAWTGFDGAHLRVRVATADPTAPFAGPQDVSAPGADAMFGDIAGSRGRRALVWTVAGLEDPEGAIQAAYAGVGASLFGAPEVVSAGPQARIPQIGFDAVTARPTVVWSERLGAARPGVAQAVARAATRTAG